MITKEKLAILKDFFTKYTTQFTSENKAVQDHFDIKTQHTWRVCENITHIGNSILLANDQLRIAEAIALLHDIGRFMQYRKYKTFMDHKSENHAKIALRVIEQEHILDDVEERTREIILQAVLNHNQPAIPETNDNEALLFSKLIRDADKLDIFKVVMIYEKLNKNLPEENQEHFKLKDEYVDAFEKEEIIRVDKISGRWGFFLLRISWIFDINFDYTLQKVKQEKYMDIFLDKLPPSDNLEKVKILVKKYFSTKKLTLAN